MDLDDSAETWWELIYNASELDEHKEFCKEIGFTPGTEKFGDCVMKLVEKD